MAAKWKGKIIGKYIGPGLRGPTEFDIAAYKFNLDLWTGSWSEHHLTISLLYMMDF